MYDQPPHSTLNVFGFIRYDLSGRGICEGYRERGRYKKGAGDGERPTSLGCPVVNDVINYHIIGGGVIIIGGALVLMM